MATITSVRDVTHVTIVGGGLAGLVAAISVAEQGGRVTLHEARARLGGRADSGHREGDGARYETNFGPHALYRHGVLESWLAARGLLPRVVYPGLTAIRLLARDRLRRLPLALLPVMRHANDVAPVDADYRSFARETLGAANAEAAIGFASLPTFHADPGVLSAAFVQERLRRTCLWRPVYYVVGGWSKLVEGLADRSRELGVEIATGSKLDALPEGPCIVATNLRAAGKLLDRPLEWPRARTALLDVALVRRRSDPAAVLDIDRRVYASDYGAADPSVCPPGESLVQCSAGIAQDERFDDGLARIHAVLDVGFPGWTERSKWSHTALSDGGAGAVDMPGRSWRDRPSIRQGEARWLVGDAVAAPGLLSEVSVASAVEAAALAMATRSAKAA